MQLAKPFSADFRRTKITQRIRLTAPAWGSTDEVALYNYKEISMASETVVYSGIFYVSVILLFSHYFSDTDYRGLRGLLSFSPCDDDVM